MEARGADEIDADDPSLAGRPGSPRKIVEVTSKMKVPGLDPT
jgi:hypothetical protein